MASDPQSPTTDGTPHPIALETTAPLYARPRRRRRFPRTIWAGRSLRSGAYRIVIEGRSDRE